MKLNLSLLLCLLFLLTLASSCSSHVITITIVIPLQLTPFYQWLEDFPVWRPEPQNHPLPIEPAPGMFQDYTLRMRPVSIYVQGYKING